MGAAAAIPRDGAPVSEVTLAGARVLLTPLRDAHYEALLEAANVDRSTFAYSTMPASRDGVRRWLDTALSLAEKKQAVPFATIDRTDGALVGSTRFAALERWDWPLVPGGSPRAPGNPDACEIGWTWLAPRAQRTPINSEAKLLMLGHAFETWKVCRVTLKTDARNQRSRSAILRIGAKLEGILRAQQPAADGGIRDTAWFSMLASEWPEAKASLQQRLMGAVR